VRRFALTPLALALLAAPTAAAPAGAPDVRTSVKIIQHYKLPRKKIQFLLQH
jgi:hypothetical protein